MNLSIKSILQLKIILLIFIITTGCTNTSITNNINDKTVAAKDPLESLNRSVFSFNESIDKIILAPVAKGYRLVFPSPIRVGIRNFFSNLSEPWTSINSTLQGNLSNAGNSIARFFINSTVGILGVFDVASKMGIEKQKEDFGQTMAIAGVGPGPYIVLPFLGPSTARDAMGKVVGLFGDPVTYIMHREDHDNWVWIGTAIEGVDFRETNLERIDNLKSSSVDFYATIRSLYLQRRSRMISNQSTKSEDPFQDFELE